MRLIALLLLLQTTICVSQTITLPLNEETGKIIYKGRMVVDGSNRDQLFTKARMWAAQIVGTEGVISMDDRTAGVIVVKSFKLVEIQGKVKKQQLNFTATLTVTDTSVNYSIGDLNFQQYTNKGGTVSYGIDYGAAMAINNNEPKTCEDFYKKYQDNAKAGRTDIDAQKIGSYITQADSTVTQLLSDLKETLVN